MSDRIHECIGVLQKVVNAARGVPAIELNVRALRKQAAVKVSSERGIRLRTVEDKYIRQLRPEIGGVGDFDAAIDAWILEGALDLHDALLAHAVDEDDRQLIAETFQVAPPPPPPVDPDLDEEFNVDVNEEGVEEGRKRLRRHWARERNRKVVAQAKEAWSAQEGGLRCAACGFDFEAVYGEHGAGFIEAHHVVPLHQVQEVRRTTVADLAPLCSNCHRIIHKIRPMPGVGEFAAVLMGR